MDGDDGQGAKYAHLQAYLRWRARQQAEVTSAPPFTIFSRQDGDGVAIPDTPLHGDGDGALRALRSAVFPATQRLRVACLAEFAPDLVSVLRTTGCEEVSRTELLGCTRSTLRPVAALDGMAMVTLDTRSSLADVREGLDTNARGFDPQAAAATDADAEMFRQGLERNRAFTAYLHGVPVGAGMFEPPHAGVAELVGITTLSDYRHRGIGTYLTANIARTAFALGVDLVYLSTSNPEARRVYERLGFSLFGTQLIFEV